MTSSSAELCAICTDATNRLTDANESYHQMVTGNKAASITTSGESVLYGQTNRQSKRDLKVYIAEIHQELARCKTCANPASVAKASSRRAFKPAFGG